MSLGKGVNADTGICGTGIYVGKLQIRVYTTHIQLRSILVFACRKARDRAPISF